MLLSGNSGLSLPCTGAIHRTGICTARYNGREAAALRRLQSTPTEIHTTYETFQDYLSILSCLKDAAHHCYCVDANALPTALAVKQPCMVVSLLHSANQHLRQGWRFQMLLYLRNVLLASLTISIPSCFPERPAIKLLICSWSKTLILSSQIDQCASSISRSKLSVRRTRAGSVIGFAAYASGATSAMFRPWK
jgi:hypothetical protein